MPCSSFNIHVHVSTPLGDSIVTDHVCHYCVVTIGIMRRVDILFFNMVDFDMTLGMDWLSLYFAIFDCHFMNVMLAILLVG